MMPSTLHPRALSTTADMNVTPLIDVLLVLLIIFMAALPLTQKGVDVAIPETTNPREPEASPPPGQIVLEYLLSGELRLNQSAVPRTDLEERLRGVFERRRDRTLYLIGDGALRYGQIVDVIDAARGAGVERVGIVTSGMRQADGLPSTH